MILYSLGNMVVVEQSIAGNLQNILSIGMEQYNSFVAERLVSQTKPVYDPISRNQLAPFRHKKTVKCL